MSLTRLAVPTLFLALALGCGGKKGPLPTLPEKVVGHCTYVNRFSKMEECRDYVGDGWTDDSATQDCRDQQSTVVLGGACNTEPRLGYCVLGSGNKFQRISFPGDDATKCASMQRGCELFGGGTFDPAPVCGGVTPGTGSTGLPTFQWPTRVCRDPKPGEAPGQSTGGQVCTWQMISAATEEGRHFDDYASCDTVRTQRPYYEGPLEANALRDDPRLADPTYAAEVNWMKSQVNATACVCCHSNRAPNGVSNWNVDQPTGNFMNGFHDRGLAMGAGWINTAGFGSYPADQNNGFMRADLAHPNETIFVTTDQARVKKLFEAELAYRGKTRADFAGEVYGAGPLDDQRLYKPTACENGEGVGADGTLTWRMGGARYVYVLAADSSSPGVPPNLDLPAGTVWRFDVPFTGNPVESGTVSYGVAPEGTSQVFPETGTAAPLKSGSQYYLYVLADIAQPNTRCLFTAP
jgi:hypothetical protein